jgi:hypothetical protein
VYYFAPRGGVVKPPPRGIPKSRRSACAPPPPARYPAAVPAENVPVTADELAERRTAARALRLIDLCEPLAVKAETAATGLREIFAQRYRALVGVPPSRRVDFRRALEGRVNVPVEEIAAALADG